MRSTSRPTRANGRRWRSRLPITGLAEPRSPGGDVGCRFSDVRRVPLSPERARAPADLGFARSPQRLAPQTELDVARLNRLRSRAGADTRSGAALYTIE